MTSDRYDAENLEAEATAFDRRITERLAAGFIPDLRRAARCDYFYKSFWRDPQFIQLFIGRIVERYVALLKEHCGPAQRILDVGCGAGYVSLELAREGHHVTAIDISTASIAAARRTLDENPYRDGFGSLDYQVRSFGEVDGQWDVVLFSVSLHHMTDVNAVVKRAAELVRPGGWVLAWEPCHERFEEKDAALVVLIRSLLALTGHWYERDEVTGRCMDEKSLSAFIRDVHTEYVLERDTSEPNGQSPNDLEADGVEILNALRGHFKERHLEPGHSFIYRLLGGLRGEAEAVHRLADFLELFDRLSVERYGLNPNHFLFLGQK